MNGLTARQQECLDLIRTSITERGYPPTIRDIMKRFGYASTNAANDLLHGLIRKGYILRDKNVARGMRLQDPPVPLPAGLCSHCGCTGACGRSQ